LRAKPWQVRSQQWPGAAWAGPSISTKQLPNQGWTRPVIAPTRGPCFGLARSVFHRHSSHRALRGGPQPLPLWACPPRFAGPLVAPHPSNRRRGPAERAMRGRGDRPARAPGAGLCGVGGGSLRKTEKDSITKLAAKAPPLWPKGPLPLLVVVRAARRAAERHRPRSRRPRQGRGQEPCLGRSRTSPAQGPLARRGRFGPAPGRCGRGGKQGGP